MRLPNCIEYLETERGGCQAIGAGVAAGVMVWQPWADDFDPAKCEAALRTGL